MEKKQKFVFLIMRIFLGVVFLLFGIGKFQNDIWAQTIRAMDLFTRLPWAADISVLLIGAGEVAVGLALIMGFFVRIFAAIAALELLGILIMLRFGEIRDIGLLGAMIYIMVMAGNGGEK